MVITAPSEDAPMFVVGVNHECYNPEMTIVSNANCSTNCIVPLCQVIHDHFEIVEGLVTIIHATTMTQKILDGTGIERRRARSALCNIFPTTTRTTEALGKIMPELEGKINCVQYRVPAADVSVVDLSVILRKEVSFELLLCRIKRAADTYLKRILGFVTEDVVSTDFISDSRSSIFDAKASMALTKNYIKLIAWYDNEFGYAHRVLDFVDFMATKEVKKST